jgi:serine/threonine-protein kinase
VLFTSSKDAVARVAILDLETGEQRILIEGQRPFYASTGHIVFVRAATLMAVPFDPAKRVLTGEPVAILDLRPTIGAPDYALSATGTLAYVSADEEDNWRGALVWVDRTGTVVARVGDPLDKPNDPRLSPNGRRVVVMTSALRDGRLWVYDLQGRPPIPLTDEGVGGAAVWSPDNEKIAFTNFGPGFPIYSVPSNGTGPSQRILSAAGVSQEWLASGELLASNRGIRATPIAGGAVRDVIAGDDREFDAALSPDGRWLAYVSDRAGQFEVWVQDYFDLAVAPVRVSSGGGYEPRWSANGEELFYLQGSSMHAVKVEIEAEEFSFDPTELLFSGTFFGAPSPETRSYDVASDGRFLMIQREDAVGANDAPANIVIVQNWFEELRRLVPTE